MPMDMTLQMETWPLKQPFGTSRFSITESMTLTVELRDGELTGRGECEPHEDDAEAAQEVLREVERIRDQIEAGISRAPRATPSTARCGISKPRGAGSAPGSWPTSRSPRHSQPPTRSACTVPRTWPPMHVATAIGRC
jgi:hypothetical protein